MFFYFFFEAKCIATAVSSRLLVVNNTRQPTCVGMDVRGVKAQELEGIILGRPGSRVQLGFKPNSSAHGIGLYLALPMSPYVPALHLQKEGLLVCVFVFASLPRSVCHCTMSLLAGIR